MKNQKQITALAARFLAIDKRRLELDRESRELQKELKILQADLQEYLGFPEKEHPGVPLVYEVGKLVITQVWNHREAEKNPRPAFDFLTFKVASKE